MRENAAEWVLCHWMTAFFTSYESWREEACRLYPGTEKMGFPVEQEYDDLLNGTCADIYIPLWASACKGNGDSLLDETTLEVVRFYYKWGYQPIKINGNPPDYIGEQFRFLCYLYGCMAHAECNNEDAGIYGDAVDAFTAQFLWDTATLVATGIRANSANGWFVRMADCLGTFLRGEAISAEDMAGGTVDLECRTYSIACKQGQNAEVPVKPAEIVNTAGRNNCGGKCGIQAVVQEGCVLHLDTGCGIGTPQVRACVRGRGYRKTYLSGRRLRYPMERVGRRGEGRFRKISWEEAAEIIAAEWKRIKEQYGPQSRYVNYGIGVSATIRPDELAKRLLALDGGYLGYYNSYSFACTRYVTPYIYGDIFSGNSVEDMLHTKLLILWGNNPAETIFGSQRNYFITRAKENGARVIVIDPRKSDSAVAYADQWIGIKPSTDSALADGMAYVIWSEGLQDQHFMDTYCLGFDEEHMPQGVPANQSYQSYLFGLQDGVHKTPQWAEQITGVPAEVITQLAREYATAKPACLLPGLGNQRIGNGEQTVRSMALLTCLTGNVGIPGGGAAGAGAVKEHAVPVFPVPANPFPGSIPCFVWTKAIEQGTRFTKKEDGLEGVDKLEQNIKMVVNFAGNTLLNQHADINNTIRILEHTGKCEFIVCSDVFMTPSAKFADILLPAPSFLEEDNIAPPWQLFGHYLLSNTKVVEPLFGCRNEYELLYRVAEKLGLRDEWSQGHRMHTGWLRELYGKLRQEVPELPEYEEFQKKGGYTYKNPKPYIAYEEQIKNPRESKFATPSGKIEIFSKALYAMDNPAEIPAIPRYVACPEGPEDHLRERFPLQMIGWHTKRRCHTIHENNSWMEEVEPQRMWMHPDDAKVRGIEDGCIVEVFNDRGRLRIPVTITDRIVKGVVAIPQGAWYTPGKDGIDERGSINVLTSTRPTPLAKGNAQHTNLVEVAPWTETAI